LKEARSDVYIKVAFFKGSPKSRLHRFIRWWTKSPYSHAELILPDNETWVSISPFLTSRLGSRKKSDVEDLNDWDYLSFKLSWREPVREYQLEQLRKFIEDTRGSKYDWFGMILSHLSPYVIKRKGRWYCSEWIAHALVCSRVIMWYDMVIHDTPDLSPGKLYNILSCTQQKNLYK